MKSPKEDYEIRKSVVSDPGTGEDLLNFLSFYTLVFNMYLYLEAINVLLKDLIILFIRLYFGLPKLSKCLYNFQCNKKMET